MSGVRMRLLAAVLFIVVCLAVLLSACGNYSNPGSGGSPGTTPTSSGY